MENVVEEILYKIKEKCDFETYNFLQSYITVKLNGYKLVKEESNIVLYEESKNVKVLKMFLISKKLQGLSDRSLKVYRREIEKMLYSINKEYTHITSDDIKYYLACMQLKGTCSSVTIDNTRRFLSTFFQYLEDEEYINKSPLKKIKKVRIKKTVKPPFSYDEIERLKLSCENKFEIALIEFLISTGVRVAELVNIKINDVRLEKNEVKVLGKGDKERIVYLNSSSKIRLMDYLNNKKESEYLFSKRQKPYDNLTTDRIREIIRVIGERAGVKDTHPHRFRRTCATIAHKRGMAIEEISVLLGHANLNTVQKYVIVDDSEVKKSHEKYMN